ncbi:MAG TPA: PBP1A family penicillin-binding protein [Candidatus Polarisedimenticolaceae bacterium]|nr:PBP1A family penicillin-binding protein [Candidatus Polarisedimenticolaceae bacterium]
MKPLKRRTLVLGALILPVAIGGATLGYGLKLDLPDVEALDRYTPPLNTRVLARDGSTIGSFGEQKRTLLAQKDIPKVFTQALIAVEDASFYEHSGLDFKGIARAAWHDLTSMSFAQGASTLTQQLSRNLFLKPDKTPKRKVEEMLLAVEVERRYSKDEILRMYCNQVYMGHGRYGLEAASEFYFAKHASELDLPEAALLAGLIQRPEGLSPFKNPDGSIKRRNHVLDRMVDAGTLTPAQASEAKKATLTLSTRRDATEIAPYFVEEVRRSLQAKYGDEGIYQQGLEVSTGIDPAFQRIASAAVEHGLRTLDKRQGWRGRTDHVADPEKWASASWRDGVTEGGIYDGVVLQTTKGRARVRAGTVTGWMDADGIKWTGRGDPAALVHAGDVIRVRVLSAKIPEQAVFALEQEPRVQGALVAIDPKTGAVRALVGGFDFSKSEFDRAVQARRQAGSSFKPFVYAAAIERGLTPSDRILDAPTVFVEPGTWSVYEPENYGNKYYGLLTAREALEKSANISAVKVLDRAGFDPVIQLARQLGVTTELKPYPSMALGAFEVSLLEMTSAYGTFANEGVHVSPYLVEEVKNREGTSLERVRPEVQEALTPEIAAMMNSLLEGVITDGTGAAAASLGRPLAGKTGTTDDFTDAWFIGYTPDLVVGVWVGFDTKKTLGSKETGAQAALPIWQEFIQESMRDVPPVPFPDAPGVTKITVDRQTGLRAAAGAGCTELIEETFLAGTEPSTECSAAEHERLAMPWTVQRYPLDESGTILVPDVDLAALQRDEPFLSIDGRSIGLAAPGGMVKLPLRITSGATPRMPASLEGHVDPTPWVGKDGRPAEVVLLGEAARADTVAKLGQ